MVLPLYPLCFLGHVVAVCISRLCRVHIAESWGGRIRALVVAVAIPESGSAMSLVGHGYFQWDMGQVLLLAAKR